MNFSMRKSLGRGGKIWRFTSNFNLKITLSQMKKLMKTSKKSSTAQKVDLVLNSDRSLTPDKKNDKIDGMDEKKPKKSGILTGLIVGGAIGSVLSLLFATKKGRETVKKLPGDALEKGRDAIRKFLEK